MSDRARMVVFIAATIALFTGISLLVHATTRFDYTRDHASTRTNPWGTKAWRELLERSGVATQTWTQPLTELTDEVSFIVLLDPLEPLRGDERQALEEWVRAGGRLVIAPFAYRETDGIGGGRARATMEQALELFGVSPVASGVVRGRAQAVADEQLTADVSDVLVPTEGRLTVTDPGEGEDAARSTRVVLSDDQGRAVAVAIARGRGMVLALSEAEILSNAALPQADNVVFAANLVFAGGAPEAVHFDEYHHGFGGGGGVYVGPEVDVGPFRNTALAVLAVVAIYAAGRSRRFGAATVATGGRRRSSADFVRALARVHSRAGAARAAASMLAAGLRRRSAAAAAMPASAHPANLASELDRRRLPGDEIADLLRRLESAGDDLSDAGLLSLAKQVAHYERML